MKPIILFILALVLGGAGLFGAVQLTNAAPADTTDATTEALTFLREEEKLARDVYLALYDTWQLPVFQNIATSEQQHMDAILNLLNTYGISDPAADTAHGEFVNPELQELYERLVERGNTSLLEALAVGGAIEEIDILDLEEQLNAGFPTDVQHVFERLLSGSYNHLRSFSRQYEAQAGIVYVPQYLDADAYDDILNDHHGGNDNNSGNGGRGRNRP
jgi:hypothetical protein